MAFSGLTWLRKFFRVLLVLTLFMNYTNHVFAVTLIVLYLFLPARNFAQAASFDAGSGVQMSSAMSAKVPCNDNPCSGGQGSGCCDTTACNCSIQAPLVQHSWFTYSPVVLVLLQPEPYWSLPQIYIPIYVPPQRFV